MEERWEIFYNKPNISQSITISLLGHWIILVAAALTDMKLKIQINQAGIIHKMIDPAMEITFLQTRCDPSQAFSWACLPSEKM